MKYTLLELVQRILESMESDEVSDIAETPESLAVANIIKECYFDIIGTLHPSEETGLFKLDASADDTKPCLMYIPSTVSKIDWLKYNTSEDQTEYDMLRFVDVEQFLSYQESLDPADTDTDQMTVTVDGKDYTFKFFNDRHPSMYTILRDYYLIFDSYDSDVEDTLTEERSLGFGQLAPSFTMSNTFTPDLDPRHFQLLLKEAKAQAYVELKQAENPRMERSARRNWVTMQKTRNDNDPRSSRQDHWTFGRK